MATLKLKQIVLTILIVLGLLGFGYLIWNYQTETLYSLIGIIALMFIRHIYVAAGYYINE
jgi:hypothetical protein